MPDSAPQNLRQIISEAKLLGHGGSRKGCWEAAGWEVGQPGAAVPNREPSWGPYTSTMEADVFIYNIYPSC